jgi:hypothetical protein
MGFIKQAFKDLKKQSSKNVVSQIQKDAKKNELAILTPGHISRMGGAKSLKMIPELKEMGINSVRQLSKSLLDGPINLGYAKLKSITSLVSNDYTQVVSLARTSGVSFRLGAVPDATEPPQIEQEKHEVTAENSSPGETIAEQMRRKRTHKKNYTAINVKTGEVKALGPADVLIMSGGTPVKNASAKVSQMFSKTSPTKKLGDWLTASQKFMNTKAIQAVNAIEIGMNPIRAAAAEEPMPEEQEEEVIEFASTDDFEL